MRRTIHIAGDGVAGLSLANALIQRGATVVVHGDGTARQGTYALVHRYAGRSFRTTSLGDAAWSAATVWLDQLVEKGTVARTRMVRPINSPAGARLGRSVGLASDVRVDDVVGFGEAFVYEPAYVVDIAASLRLLAATVEVREGRVEQADVFAVGADLRIDGLQAFGGHLVEFEGDLGHAVSGGGIHAVPTPRGICVGSTFWDAQSPQRDEDARVELRSRASGLGLEIGETLGTWRGIRCVSELDRRPVVGTVRGDFVVGALGTRGWFWAAMVAAQAASALLDDVPIHPDIDAARLGPAGIPKPQQT